jgi:hypothetical protein
VGLGARGLRRGPRSARARAACLSARLPRLRVGRWGVCAPAASRRWGVRAPLGRAPPRPNAFSTPQHPAALALPLRCRKLRVSAPHTHTSRQASPLRTPPRPLPCHKLRVSAPHTHTSRQASPLRNGRPPRATGEHRTIDVNPRVAPHPGPAAHSPRLTTTGVDAGSRACPESTGRAASALAHGGSRAARQIHPRPWGVETPLGRGAARPNVATTPQRRQHAPTSPRRPTPQCPE